MRSRLFGLLAVIGMSAGAIICGNQPAQAGGYCSEMVLTCENGRSYPLCPIAVSDEGEIVTGHLVLGPGRGVHVRLMPLGVGYRYAGRGIWFDGAREHATLFFGKHSSVECMVSRQ